MALAGAFGKALRTIPDQVAKSTGRPKKPKFVPAGLDADLFALDTLERLNDKEQVGRREKLDAATPGLQSAIASGDIFAYNAALAKFRDEAGLGAEEMPERKRKRRKPGSREKTLGFI